MAEVADVPGPAPDGPGTGQHQLGPLLVASLGGKRGVFDSGLPAVVFVLVNSVVATLASRHTALDAAIAASVLSGLGVLGLRLRRHETVQQAASGFLGLAVAVFFAARSGQARDFFKPGIYINAGYGALFALSVLVRRPLVGVAFAAVEGLGSGWRRDRRLIWVFSVATVGWALVYALRSVATLVFYNAHRTDLLAGSRLLLGWPLTIAAVAATMSYVRRSRRRADRRRGSAAEPVAAE